MLIKVNHQELIRDYAGYEFIQDEMESTIKLFLQLYFKDILGQYRKQSLLTAVELHVSAAGAGTSKFVFGITVEEVPTWTFGIRFYQNKGQDKHRPYKSAKEYRTDLETYDKELIKIIADEIKVYREFKTKAQTSIDIQGVWTKFPLGQGISYIDNLQCPFFYIKYHKLKYLLTNLGINAITVGDFIIGYDGRKILEREEFTVEDKLHALVQICNTLLQSWLLTTRYDDLQQIIGRSIVDLKPAQFVVQTEEKTDEQFMPAVIVDVGPAENTDTISTYFKSLDDMKELVPAFAGQMLKKLVLSESDHQRVKQDIGRKILNYLEQCKQTKNGSKKLRQEELIRLVEELSLFIKRGLLS